MQPEYLIAGAYTLFQTAPGVKVLDLARPRVTALDTRNQSLADAELYSDVFLHSTGCDSSEYIGVAFVERLHALSLSADDAECVVRLFSLDGDEGANGKQEPLDIGSRGNGVTEKPLVASLYATAVFFDATVTQPLMDGVQCRPDGVGEPQANPAFILIDLDTAFPIKEACDVAQEGVFAPILHPYSIPHARVSNNAVMAVPVMRWIGERIAAVDALTERQAA